MRPGPNNDRCDQTKERKGNQLDVHVAKGFGFSAGSRSPDVAGLLWFQTTGTLLAVPSSRVSSPARPPFSSRMGGNLHALANLAKNFS